ncbi:MAG TPA: alanine racemase [Bacillota bacterium]|nr:alanine racemase [Bacillota bacterium]
MIKQPRVIIHLAKLAHNFQTIAFRAARAGIKITGVLKGTAGDPEIARTLIEAGLLSIGDSRIENLAQLRNYPNLERMMVRLPAKSRLSEVFATATCSLNAEVEILQGLNDVAEEKHQVFLMVDLGDLREGVAPVDLMELGRFCRKLRRLAVVGLGTNFSCFAGVIPTVSKLKQLIQLAEELQSEAQLPIQYISGGNSSSLALLYQGTIPRGINHLRIGEGILAGKETLSGGSLPDLYQDAFILEAEVIQSQWKPARPEGKIGLDAFGRVPQLTEVPDGIRLLLNIGHQDTPLTGLKPLDPEVTVLGGSSDYLVAAGSQKHKVGQTLSFIPNYWSILGLMTSPYVSRTYIQ